METNKTEGEMIVGQHDLYLITCLVQRGKADRIAKAALDSGAGGVTVHFARGMGLRERLGLLGLAIVPEKEVITVVSDSKSVQKIFNAMVKAGSLDLPGMGIAYVHPLTAVVGLIPPNASGLNNGTGSEHERA